MYVCMQQCYNVPWSTRLKVLIYGARQYCQLQPLCSSVGMISTVTRRAGAYVPNSEIKTAYETLFYGCRKFREAVEGSLKAG